MEDKLVPKESREVLRAVMEFAVSLCEKLADGYQPSDLSDLVQSLLFDSVYRDAITGSEEIGDELAKIDEEQIAELFVELVSYAPRFVKAFKKK